MTFSKILLLGSLVLFVGIGTVAIVKRSGSGSGSDGAAVLSLGKDKKEKVFPMQELKAISNQDKVLPLKDPFPNIDRLDKLFSTGSNKLPIVETVTYTSSVPWLKGRPAWIADYAAYYSTSRHFIARSLNGKADYLSQKVTPGSRFNVFRNDKHFSFYLVVDLSISKMGLYYVDLDTQERVLLKTYRVGLGRLDAQKPSGCLTPVGKYALGNKVAVYKQGTIDQKVDMVTVFGTRWLPFGQDLDPNSHPAKGYGLHGAPWKKDAKTGEYVEYRECIGKYESDGSVQLASEDMEELFAIVITKPTVVEIVKQFSEAKLPGIEVATPTR